jgi:hypothetical protein
VRDHAHPGLRTLAEPSREAVGEAPITEPASAEIAEIYAVSMIRPINPLGSAQRCAALRHLLEQKTSDR